MIRLAIEDYAIQRCPTVCEKVEYHIQMPTSGKNYVEYENTTTLWVWYASPKIKIEEEYMVMGANAMISATGGSLGLFLGLSCYGVAWKILEKVETMFKSLLPLPKKTQVSTKTNINDNVC